MKFFQLVIFLEQRSMKKSTSKNFWELSVIKKVKTKELAMNDIWNIQIFQRYYFQAKTIEIHQKFIRKQEEKQDDREKSVWVCDLFFADELFLGRNLERIC